MGVVERAISSGKGHCHPGKGGHKEQIDQKEKVHQLFEAKDDPVVFRFYGKKRFVQVEREWVLFLRKRRILLDAFAGRKAALRALVSLGLRRIVVIPDIADLAFDLSAVGYTAVRRHSSGWAKSSSYSTPKYGNWFFGGSHMQLLFI